MSKEFFAYSETPQLLEVLDQAARRSAVSRGQAFDDFLQMVVCSLSGGRMEQQYLQVVVKHTEGVQGKRGCDSLTELFAKLIVAMDDSRNRMKDVLGDLFQGAVSYGANQQFFTPQSLCEAMARMTIEGAEVTPGRFLDPCCGSGRMLLAAAAVSPSAYLVGQDIDLRCVRITAINLALRNLYGEVIWGDTLAHEQRLVYRTGFDGQGFLRELAPEWGTPTTPAAEARDPQPVTDAPPPGQLHLF